MAQRNQQHTTAKLAASTCYYFVLSRINLKVIYLDQINLLLCAISCPLFVRKQIYLDQFYLLLWKMAQRNLCAISCLLFVGKQHSEISSTYTLIFLAIQKLFISKCKVLYLGQLFYCVLLPAHYLLENSTAKLAAPTCYYLLLFRTNLKVRYLDQIIFLLCAISCPQVFGKQQSEISSTYLLLFLAIQKLFRIKCKVIYLDYFYLFVCAISYLLFVGNQRSKISSTYLLLLLAIQKQFQGDIPGSDQSFIVCYFLPRYLLEKQQSEISSTYMLIFLAIQKLFRNKCKVIYRDHFYLLLSDILCLLFVGKQPNEISSITC